MNKAERVVIIGPAYPYRGGPAALVGHLYHLLTQSRQVDVISFSRLYPKILFPGKCQEDISLHPIKPHPAERTIDSIGPASWLRASHRVAQLKPDLVIVDWYQPFFGLSYGTILHRIHKLAPIIIMAENIISHEARWIDGYLTRRTFRHADAFIAFSQAVAERLHQMYPMCLIERAYLPLFITPNHSPEKITQEQAKAALGIEGKRMLLFFGYIRPYKGLQVLIEAFTLLARQRDDTVLFIVGECYEDPTFYRKLIEETGVANRIRWVNHYVPNESVPLYYSAADIVVLPYRSATQSGVQRIAFAFGKPVVVSDVGGLAEEVRAYGAGEIVLPGVPHQLADTLARMLNLPSLDQYTERARRAIEATRFEHIEHVIDHLYLRLVSRDGV